MFQIFNVWRGGDVLGLEICGQKMAFVFAEQNHVIRKIQYPIQTKVSELMKPSKFLAIVLFLSLSGLAFGGMEASTQDSKLAKKTAKAEKKISMAIGQEIGEFSILSQEKTEATAGYYKTQYAVVTNDGRTYKCEILEGSGFYKVATFGAGSGADATCTDFTKGSRNKGSVNKNIDKPSMPETKGSNVNVNADNTSAKAIKLRARAERKISMAIGEEVGQFTIANQQKAETSLGYNKTLYTVNTQGGKTYKCEILEGSGFYKVATFGTGSGADAMCTDFTRGSKDRGKINKASCNTLLKSAGKC